SLAAGPRQDGGDCAQVFDVQFAFPEALEGNVEIALQYRITLALGPEHAGGGEGGVPDLGGAADHQTAFARLPPAIHVAVLDPAPLMRVAVFLDYLAALVEPGGAQKAWDVEHIREPIQAHR